MPTAPIIQNTIGQPYACVTHAISGANSTVAKYCAELKMADAVPRSLAGNHAATMRPFAGNDGASARPTSSRNENSATIAVPTVP